MRMPVVMGIVIVCQLAGIRLAIDRKAEPGLRLFIIQVSDQFRILDRKS